jgi:hypothetical protein
MCIYIHRVLCVNFDVCWLNIQVKGVQKLTVVQIVFEFQALYGIRVQVPLLRSQEPAKGPDECSQHPHTLQLSTFIAVCTTFPTTATSHDTFSSHFTNKILHAWHICRASVTCPPTPLPFHSCLQHLSTWWAVCITRLLATVNFLSLPHSFHQQLGPCGQTSRNYRLVNRLLTDLSLPVISTSTNCLAMNALSIRPGMLTHVMSEFAEQQSACSAWRHKRRSPVQFLLCSIQTKKRSGCHPPPLPKVQ